MPRYYLDYAATAAIRPPSVPEAVYRFLSEVGASPGRGSHRLAAEAGRLAVACREAVIRALGLPEDPTRVVFTQNATQALNLALLGLLRQGDRAVVTSYDHNAVLRPLHLLSSRLGVEVKMVEGAPDGSLDLEQARAYLEGARLVVVNAVSNVLGTRLPLGDVAGLARDAGALVLVDGAQWAGHFTESLSGLGADMVAFTGHKGLLGPQGIGGLWIREGLELAPYLAGGTGGRSQDRSMPPRLPERLEAGT
jgi:selenocysteine lyase/cysteine desulfurase